MTLKATFPEADDDLRQRVARAVELPQLAVPMINSCLSITDGYTVRVSSRWLGGRWFEVTLSESSLRNLDSDWQDFCNRVAEAFKSGPLNI